MIEHPFAKFFKKSDALDAAVDRLRDQLEELEKSVDNIAHPVWEAYAAAENADYQFGMSLQPDARITVTMYSDSEQDEEVVVDEQLADMLQFDLEQFVEYEPGQVRWKKLHDVFAEAAEFCRKQMEGDPA